jgi:hypothetical protein
MKHLFFISLLLAATIAFSQTAPRFKKYDVSDSKFSLYLPAIPGAVSLEYSPDSAKVYTLDALDSTYGAYFHFGAIVVEDLATGDNKEDLLISYMDYLKTSFNIVSAAGYGKGHTLTTHPSAMGVLDYWEDKDGDQWKVKGWIDSKSIVFMFIYGSKEYPNYNVAEIFFNGIRFPGD